MTLIHLDIEYDFFFRLGTVALALLCFDARVVNPTPVTARTDSVGGFAGMTRPIMYANPAI